MLPTYDKSKRRKTFETLPKGAYVIKILNAHEEEKKNKPGKNLVISFDIAEGEYKDIYMSQYTNSTSEDRKWPNDGVFRLNVPDDRCEPYVWTNWNTFFADLEDSNNGFVFNGNPAGLRGKLIGGKMRIEQSEYNGKIYDHVRLYWTCVADDVRNGKAGKLPNDKLIVSAPAASPAIKTDADGFMQVADSVDEEVPWV